MDWAWEAIVGLLFFILFYTYVGYPLLVYVLARLRDTFSTHSHHSPEPSQIDKKTDWPMVSILIPAFNEENVIRKKVENTLSVDYPKDRLQIVIVSDGSTDQTDAMLASYSEQEIEVVHMSKRQGKTAVLNRMIPVMQGEIVVLSDASGLIRQDALKQLVHHFKDPKVGGVCGTYVIDADDESLRSITEKFYWQYETFLKKYESLLHSSIGAHGAFYGFRRALFTPLSEKAINDDFILPMQIVGKGLRVIYEPQAMVEEHETTSLVGEFRRRTRINVGNFQQIYILLGLLYPARGIVAFEFFSHKVLRAFSPFVILALPIACFFASGPIIDLLLQLQLAFYLFGILGYLQEFVGLRIRYLYLPFYFLAGNVSAIIGFFKFIFRKQSLLWERV